MGSCTSCEATAVGPTTTAKLILVSGELREINHPMKAGLVLEKKSEFICDADEMEMDGFLTAVNLNDELRMGQIYFVLPRSMLKKRICGDDLAALAVKANAVLVNARTPLVLTERVIEKSRRRSVRGRNFVPDLSVIVE